MADLSGLQDPTGGEYSTGFGPLEPGEYTLALVKSEMLESKNSPGNWYLACEFENQDGAGRVWQNFNLVNANAQAIAWRDFNALCHACGKLGVQDSSEIHGIPFTARVGFEKDKSQPGGVNKERNRITSYKPLNAGATAAYATGNAGAQAGAAGAKKPWQQ
ncbi:DUF669 domain-containing protein [Sagittula sp. S175]|uniref:DUF669 domain-containing protein n=1 Tax=Sagittula sp. S175 TaxID=3415129 RepID=UPI003C7AAE78